MKIKIFSTVLIVWMLFSCNSKKSVNAVTYPTTVMDMEKEIAGFKLSEDAYQGKKSLIVKNKTPYVIDFKGVKKGDLFHITMREKGSGTVSFSENLGNFYIEGRTLQGDKKKWETISIRAKATADGDYELRLKQPNEGEIALYDDLKIEKLTRKTPLENGTTLSFNLLISDKNLKKIEDKKEKALKDKILITKKEDWVKANLVFDADTIPVKIRLKGDWTDHLKGEKWSMRIKVKNEKYVLGMKEFSIQSPETRGMLTEWLFHQILEKEDILTTSYQFGLVKINNEMKGVFAVEEHFTKLLVENRNRREGPIVKYNEKPLWQSRAENNTRDYPNIRNFNAADVVPFGKKKTMNSPTLKGQYITAKNLLYQNQFGLKKSSEIFDVERLAKYMAITDITNSYHGTIWHNQRWYFNGITELLEPIGYDGYAEQPADFWDEKPCFGCLKEGSENTPIPYSYLTDSLFRVHYFHDLEQYFTPTYFASFFKEIEADLKRNEAIIQLEYPDYKYDRTAINTKQATIENWLKKKNHKAIYDDKTIAKTPISVPNAPYLPVSGLSVVAYKNAKNNYTLINVHQFPIAVVGIGNNTKEMEKLQTIIINPYLVANEPQRKTITTAKKGSHFYYTVAYSDSIFTAQIINAIAPQNSSPAQELAEKSDFIDKIFIKDVGNSIILKGNHKISSDIVIPKGYRVEIAPNTTIDLTNNAKFISYSPIEAKGTEKMPIKIYSSDGTGNGFTVLLADAKSQLNYVTFENLNTLNYKGWVLTGAVVFYESDVVVNNCQFINNKCEDALNIVRSTFEMNNSHFQGIFSDAFDGDFCVGTVNNSTFNNIGNDAIDFSGSQIKVFNCTMKKVSDKGISIGENSTVEAKNCTISGAAIGISAKDLSKASVDKITFEECKYGFAIYQKKPQFGPASAIAKNIIFKACENEFILDLNSTLNIEGKEKKGAIKIDIDALFY